MVPRVFFLEEVCIWSIRSSGGSSLKANFCRQVKEEIAVVFLFWQT